MPSSVEKPGYRERKLASLDELRTKESLSALYKCHLAGPLHDLNNLLFAISGYTELLTARMPGDSKEKLCCGNIRKAAMSASDYIRHLHAHLRDGEYDRPPVNANSVITETVLITEHLIPPEISVMRNLHPSPCMVRAYPPLLQNSIINLMFNAREAMPGGGRLTFSTGFVRADAAYVGRFPYASEGEFVSIRVEDTGTGMDEEQMKGLFAPFHSTKAKTGRGLGLFSVLSFAKRNNGHVNVDSRKGRGSCFEICLPAYSPEGAG